jgi:LysM repeat protein
VRKAAIGVGAFLFMAVVLAQTAHGSTPGGVETVTVSPGQTLWQIAAERYPDADTRAKVVEIERLNGLAGPGLQVGEQLKVPAA